MALMIIQGPPSSRGGKPAAARKNNAPKYTSTRKSVELIMHGKKVTRVVHLNQHGTQVVKDNGAWVLLSKQKRA